MSDNDCDPIIANSERVAEIAIRAFGRAKDVALTENERLGVNALAEVRKPVWRRWLCM
jgi:hypothetical protein